MTEITESIDKTGLPEAGARRLPWHCPSQKWASNQDCEIIHRFVDARTRSDKITNAPTFSTNRSGPALRAERNSGMRTKRSPDHVRTMVVKYALGLVAT